MIPNIGDPIEITYLFSEQDQCHIVRTQVAWDEVTGEVFSVMIVLQPAPANPPEHLELQFYFVVADEHNGDSITQISDGRQTRGIIPEVERANVLHVVCAATQHLLEIVKPEKVHYITVDTYLPEKALRKYIVLCEAICEKGYKGGMVDRFLGCDMWICQRTAS